MDAQPLYDLTPLTRLMLMGVVLAMGPLAWVWLRHRGADRARRIEGGEDEAVGVTVVAGR